MTNYDELAAWAESDAPTIRPDAAVRQGTGSEQQRYGIRR